MQDSDLARRVTAVVRDVPDFPSPGILFKDITPVLADPSLMAEIIAAMTAPFRDDGITHIVAIESRGFLFGMPMALALRASFVPVRKPGKLPWETVSESYALEYREDVLEMHRDAVNADSRVLVVDDVLATGGTLLAAHGLAKQLRAEVAGASMLIELGFLNGRARWDGDAPLHAALVV